MKYKNNADVNVMEPELVFQLVAAAGLAFLPGHEAEKQKTRVVL